MALDANIILGGQAPKIISGDERAANASKLQSLLLGNQEAQMKMQEYQRQRADEDALREFYRTNPNATGEQLRGQGYVKQGFEADKFKGEQAKNQSEIQAKAIETAYKKADLFGRAAGYVKNNPTPENAHGAIDQLASIGALIPEEAQRAHMSVPKDSAGISAWAHQHYVSALAAKDQLPKIDTQNLGGAHVTQSVDPVTGKVSVLNTMQNTQSPDSIASNTRMAAEGAANRAIQIRGQNLVDARAKDKNQIDASGGGYSTKPLPASALGLQNDALDALATASNIDKDLGAIYNELDKGELKLGLINNSIGQARNFAGVSDQNSRNLGSFKATLEKLRNDSLRLNKGVQTDGDAQRAWNELLANINDQEFVKKRLTEIREINKRGAQLQKLKVDTIRSNFNAAPMDYSKYESLPTAIGNNIMPNNERMPNSHPPEINDLLKKYGGK